MNKTATLIMAGGQGKRMDVLCHIRPKPALPFAGKFRVIDFTLSNCMYSGIHEIAILTDYQRAAMADYLTRWNLANTSAIFHVLEPDRGSYKGTADSVYQTLPYLNAQEAENVLLLAGDHVYKMDYREMIAFHEQTKADVTVGIIKMPLEESHRFGMIAVNEAGEIANYVEKAYHPGNVFASMGIYVFNREILNQCLREDATRADSLHDFGYSILPGMIGQHKVMAYEFHDYWQDIGTPRAFYNAHMELIRLQPAFSLNHSRTVLTQQLELQPPRIYPHAVVTNSIISPGCVIKGRVKNSILSPGVIVEEQAEVNNSVLMADVIVGYHSVVDTCVIDEEVRIGKLCYVGFGESSPSSDTDITVLGKGVTVPSRTAIGRHCTIYPHIDLSSYSYNLVSSDTVISTQGLCGKACEGIYPGT